MSLLSLINEVFPANRAPGAELFVWTRRGDILSGHVRQCDDRGMVLETARGTVLVLARSLVAIADRREALKPAAPLSTDLDAPPTDQP